MATWIPEAQRQTIAVARLISQDGLSFIEATGSVGVNWSLETFARNAAAVVRNPAVGSATTAIVRDAAVQVGGTLGSAGLVTLKGILIGGLVLVGVALTTTIGVTAYQAYSAGAEADEAEAIAERTGQLAEERRLDHEADISTPDQDFGFGGYAAIQVTNHSGQAVAVRSMDAIARHQDGSQPMLLCNFMHGGRCPGDVVNTPNGNVTIESSPVAAITVLHQADSSAEAWAFLCGRLTEVRTANMADGFMGNFQGQTVTVDRSGFRSPCS